MRKGGDERARAREGKEKERRDGKGREKGNGRERKKGVLAPSLLRG